MGKLRGYENPVAMASTVADERPTGHDRVKSEAGNSADPDQRDISSLQSFFNANRYATKKTIAQGVLDLALLASNAAQLKYLLKIGDSHEFYILLLSLIVSSICLQVIQAIACVILGLVLNINKVNEQRISDIINNVTVAITMVTVAINVIISAFDLKG